MISAKTATNKKQNKSETLEVETEEADKQGISIEEVLKNRAGGFVPAQGIALSEAEAGRFKDQPGPGAGHSGIWFRSVSHRMG